MALMAFSGFSDGSATEAPPTAEAPAPTTELIIDLAVCARFAAGMACCFPWLKVFSIRMKSGSDSISGYSTSSYLGAFLSTSAALPFAAALGSFAFVSFPAGLVMFDWLTAPS